MSDYPNELAVDGAGARKLLGNPSKATFERMIADGRVPPPFYPSPRIRRWWPSELRAAMAQLRMLPSEAKAERRARRLAAAALRCDNTK